MKPYLDLDGVAHDLDALDAEERRLLTRLRRFAATHDHHQFHNKWFSEVPRLYLARGLSRKAVIKTTLWEVCQDMGARMDIAAGEARMPDYRDQLEELIRTKFRNRREFCEASGLSEDMLSHVLARRKHLSLDRLTEALERIGYRLQIAPHSNG